jgi:hypothetical protein
MASVCLALAIAEACGGEGNHVPAITVTVDAAGPEVVLLTVSMRDNFSVPSTIHVPRGMPVGVRAANDGVEVHNILVDGADGETAFLSGVRVSAGESSTFEMLLDSPRARQLLLRLSSPAHGHHHRRVRATPAN